MKTFALTTLLLVLALSVSNTEAGWRRAWRRVKEKVTGVVVGKAVGAVLGGKRDVSDADVWAALTQQCPGNQFDTSLPVPDDVKFVYVEVFENNEATSEEEKQQDWVKAVENMDFCEVGKPSE